MAIPKDVTDALNSMHGFAATHPAFNARDLNVLTQHIDAQDVEITKLRRIVSHEHIVADVALSSKSVMVAKLRELVIDADKGMLAGVGSMTTCIDAILSSDPAEPATLSDFVNLPPADKQRVGLEVAEMATDMQRNAEIARLTSQLSDARDLLTRVRAYDINHTCVDGDGTCEACAIDDYLESTK